MTARESPIDTYIRRNYTQNLYTVHRAAEMVGKSTDTLRRWRRLGITHAPSKTIQMGYQTVYLYTETDLKELRELAEHSERGKLLTPTKRRKRENRRSAKNG